jgi:hypothetical protein
MDLKVASFIAAFQLTTGPSRFPIFGLALRHALSSAMFWQQLKQIGRLDAQSIRRSSNRRRPFAACLINFGAEVADHWFSDHSTVQHWRITGEILE